jgi:lipoic acid synthetase
VEPAEFDELAVEATEIGFEGVLSGPLVRSSYRAGRLYRQASDALAAANASTSQPENESTDGE